MPHMWTSTEGNGKRSSADASVATVSHGVELTQCSEGESGFPGCSEGKEFGCNAGNPGSTPGWGRSPGEWLPTPVFLPGEFHGQRSLASYSPYSWKESDMTERLILSVRASQNEREKPFQRGLQASSRARLLQLSS